MIAMAHEVSIALVPVVKFARPILSIALFSLMFILGCVSLVGKTSLSSWPFAILWSSAQRATNLLFGRYGRHVFYFSSLLHVAEAIYCAHLTSSLMKTGGRGYGRVAGWSIQTLLCGFPPLFLLLERLDRFASTKDRVD
jgi:Domain of unknown function (DUF4499)